MNKSKQKNIVYILLFITISIFYIFNEFVYKDEANPEDIQGVEVKEDNAYKVIKVIDGDTLELESIGKVRLIGVDTPETVDPRKEVECFGKEASEYTKTILLNNYITIEYDNTQDKEDKYGRDLVYIFKDNINFNLELIQKGYAYEYTYKVPYKYQREFKDAQSKAKETKQGIWGDICN